MNAQAILTWVKANVFIVIFAVVMVAAAIVLPIIAGGWSAEVKKTVNERAQNVNKLDQLLKEPPRDPQGQEMPGATITDQFLVRYEEVAAKMDTDAKAVQGAALKHNKKNRDLVLKDVFPAMPETMRDVLPKRFHDRLKERYNELLKEVKAGMPPPLESMRETLVQARSTFISQTLKKDPSSPDPLPPEELAQLTEHLAKTRMGLNVAAASGIGMYLSANELYVPMWEQENQPNSDQMFSWQWQFWVVDDILRALHEANQTDGTVIRSPVKQVLGLSILNLPGAAAKQGNTTAPPKLGPSAPAGGGLSEGAGGGGGGELSEADLEAASNAQAGGTPGAVAAAPVTGGLPDPKTPVPVDFKAYLTGRISNSLYDVINVQLDLVVETDRLPEVLDGLAKYNFMTVTELSLTPSDPFAAARYGYVYGSKSVSTVSMILQTVWLREWTIEFMPDGLRAELGVPPQQSAAPAEPPPA